MSFFVIIAVSMTKAETCLISVVVPVYNEAAGLELLHDKLVEVAERVSRDSYELIYCDDGSRDGTSTLVQDWAKINKNVKLIKLSRNFGKENALSAGIAQAVGEAIVTIDGDGQHPVEIIPKFVEAWQKGAQVVVGVRASNSNEGWFKRLGSTIFYGLFNKFTREKMLPGSTDFRLIDRAVQQAFLSLNETDRITRGLIDWLGFKRELIYFTAKPRLHGTAGYSAGKLVQLAINSFVSLTFAPLYIFGYVGAFITATSFVLGIAIFVEQLLLGDPWHWQFTGTAMLAVLILFLVGLVLLSQGVLSVYVSHLHAQSKQRPLYVIDYKGSSGIKSPRNET